MPLSKDGTVRTTPDSVGGPPVAEANHPSCVVDEFDFEPSQRSPRLGGADKPHEGSQKSLPGAINAMRNAVRFFLEVI